jgi:hypothetical protein
MICSKSGLSKTICVHSYHLYKARRKWRHCNAISDMSRLIVLVIYHIAHWGPLVELAFLTRVSKKLNSVSSRAVPGLWVLRDLPIIIDPFTVLSFPTPCFKLILHVYLKFMIVRRCGLLVVRLTGIYCIWIYFVFSQYQCHVEDLINE